ncbi:TRAP transporter large permease [Caldimonas sp. KR1-144]|uniref:TRAP transporter large permease n=1 Tax=Caldimonas sp. KR1-144 TaxID=3400911 RepID=UPI003C0D336E
MNAPVLLTLAGLAGCFALIALQVPVGVAMGIAGVAGFAALSGLAPALATIASEAANQLASLDLATIPLFVLMGAFAGMAGLSEDLYRLAYALVGHRRGGLAMATIGGCAGFGAVCGSSVATAATFGRASLPSMLSRGYAPGFAAGTVASGGTLGILIPPSSIMVIYAVLSQELIISLYVAALVPAAIAVALHITAIALHTRRHPSLAPVGPRATAVERWQAVRRSAPVLTLAATVIGGMAGGVFTATESAAVGAVMAFGFALLRRSVTRAALSQALGGTASTAAMIYVLIIGASLFGTFTAVTQAPQALVEAVQASGVPVWAAMLALMALYLVAGAVFDEVAAMVVTLPFVLPLIRSWGFDPVWWGVINVVVIELGMLIPPLGMNVFVVKGVAPQIPLADIYRGVAPYVASNLVRLGLLLTFPALSLWLPTLLKS